MIDWKKLILADAVEPKWLYALVTGIFAIMGVYGVIWLFPERGMVTIAIAAVFCSWLGDLFLKLVVEFKNR